LVLRAEDTLQLLHCFRIASFLRRDPSGGPALESLKQSGCLLSGPALPSSLAAGNLSRVSVQRYIARSDEFRFLENTILFPVFLNIPPLGFSTFQWLFFPRFHSKNLHQGRENWEMGRAGEWNDEKNQRSLSRFFASLRP
jgi:hypothetical protein